MYTLSASVGNPRSDNLVCPFSIPVGPVITLHKECPRTPGGTNESDDLESDRPYNLHGTKFDRKKTHLAPMFSSAIGDYEFLCVV